MKSSFAGLILNDKLYPIDDLIANCTKNLKNKHLPLWELDVYGFILELLNDDDYIQVTTSGSTGLEKRLRLPKRALIESAKNTAQLLDLRFAQTAVLCLPVKYIAGKMMIVRAIYSGLNLKLVEPTSMPDLNAFSEIDFCAMVPIQAYNSLSSYEFQTKIGTLIIGGGEIRDELEVKLRALPNRVYETYGMAETCSHIALRRINGDDPQDSFKANTGVELGTDERGCLIVKVPYLAEPVITNDLVQLIDKSSFRWIGRIDNTINSGGIKIQPESLEKRITQILNMPCAVVDQPHSALGQKVVLVLEQGDANKNSEQVISALKPVLEKQFVPKDVLFVEKLPRNSSLKLDRISLRLLVKELMG